MMEALTPKREDLRMPQHPPGYPMERHMSRKRARIKVKSPEEFERWQRLAETVRQRREKEATSEDDILQPSLRRGDFRLRSSES
jgi:hypothetical protein